MLKKHKINNYKTYDCFPYDGEEILDLRLKVLYDYVDYFVIGESNIAFSGDKKDFKFDIKKYKWAEKKIRYFKFYQQDFVNCQNSWDRERASRNLLKIGLFDIQDCDRVLISDCDEIFDPVNLQPPIKNTIFVYDHAKYLFYGDYSCLNNPVWRHAVSFNGSLVNKFQLYDIRHIWKFFENKKNNTFIEFNLKVIQNGGWHFSYLGERKMIFDKIAKFPDDFISSALDAKYLVFLKKNLEKMILKGIDIYYRPNIWGKVKNFHKNNLIVLNWFQENPKYFSPNSVKNYGKIDKFISLYYYLNKKNHVYINIIKFFLRVRNKFFLYFKISIF